MARNGGLNPQAAVYRSVRQQLNHGTETETPGYGGPAEVVIDSRGGSVRLSVWRRPGSRRAVFFDAAAARRLADAVEADASDDETLVTETAAAGADVVVRHRSGRRELTIPRQLRRGRRLIRLDPFETAVATGLREAAAEIDAPAASDNLAAVVGGERQ